MFLSWYIRMGVRLTQHTSSSVACCFTSATWDSPQDSTDDRKTVSRTKFVTSSGNNASWAYTFLKGLNFPFALIGLADRVDDAVRPIIPLGETTGSAIFRVIGLLLLLPLALDWLLTKFSMAKRPLGTYLRWRLAREVHEDR